MSTTDKLAEALRLAHDHIEMDKLMVSHPRDWVLIKDALAQAEAKPAEPVGWTAGERAAFEADEARRELGSLLMSMAIIRELTKTQQCHADETVAAVRAMLAAAPAAPAPAGHVLVPLEVLIEASRAIGHFVSDEGWGAEDMQAIDNLDAYIAQHMARAASKGEQA